MLRRSSCGFSAHNSTDPNLHIFALRASFYQTIESTLAFVLIGLFPLSTRIPCWYDCPMSLPTPIRLQLLLSLVVATYGNRMRILFIRLITNQQVPSVRTSVRTFVTYPAISPDYSLPTRPPFAPLMRRTTTAAVIPRLPLTSPTIQRYSDSPFSINISSRIIANLAD